jgi:uncharacterized protein YwqG
MEQAKPIPCISLKTGAGQTSMTGSKFGGYPYLPKDFEYPTDSKGRPLKLLAQLNFADLPHLDHFPTEGILQFFVLFNWECGVNYENLTKQDTFRVVYHKVVVSENLQQDTFPTLTPIDDAEFPFQGEFAVTGTIEQDRFHNSEDETMEESIDCGRHKIGGYPFFTQYDPRVQDERLSKYDTLLFQMDSETDGDNGYKIIWGDCGVANFFISLENLKKCDFSDVMYTMDCY